MAKDTGRKLVANNKKARHDYLIEDVFEAGIVLSGTEVKALRAGRASLTDGWCTIDGGEAWLDAVFIPEYTEGTWTNHAPRRKRKLLLHKQEIVKLSHKVKEGGYTLVPLQIYFSDGRAKVEIAVAKGKDVGDKRQTIKEREQKREMERALRRR